VTVSIAYGQCEDLRVVSFPGDGLKRVSPDERSISFFLLKANEIAENLLFFTQRTMDNGIIVRRRSLSQLIDVWSPNGVYLAIRSSFQPSDYHGLKENSLFVYALTDDFKPERIDFTPLPRPSTPERHILEINTSFDSRE
jgi:tRNA pseudouridine-54 N-methylase